jgi:hypothetical protein
MPIDLPATGFWGTAEKRVLTVFAITAIALMTRTQPFEGVNLNLLGVAVMTLASWMLLS